MRKIELSNSSAQQVTPWQISGEESSDAPQPTDVNAIRAIRSFTGPATYFRWKIYLWRFLALFLCVPAIPAILVLMVLVRVTSRGPAIYHQIRVGKNGKSFTMYKLRSMRVDAECDSGPVWSQDGDARVTPIGRFLRDTHLDELPQLFNVVKGEMDLFGPRPERPEFTKVLAEEINGFQDRLQVLPGVTGLAQINLPADTDLASVRKKLILDLEYIETASLSLDLRMLFATFLRLFGYTNEKTLVTIGVKRTVTDDEVKASENSQRFLNDAN